METIEEVMTRTVREVARDGGVDPRHVKICFREQVGDVQPVEVRVRMRARGGLGRTVWAEGFGRDVWAAAAMCFAEVEAMKRSDFVVVEVGS